MGHELEKSVIKERLMEIHGTTKPEINDREDIVLSLPETRALSTFYLLGEIWTPVENINYVPRRVATELIVRIDGKEKKTNQFTVFLANRQRMLKNRMRVEPLCVTPKQKYQFYDVSYLNALLGSIIDYDSEVYTSDSPFALNRIEPAYKIVDSINPQILLEMYEVFYQSLYKAYGR